MALTSKRSQRLEEMVKYLLLKNEILLCELSLDGIEQGTTAHNHFTKRRDQASELLESRYHSRGKRVDSITAADWYMLGDLVDTTGLYHEN